VIDKKKIAALAVGGAVGLAAYIVPAFEGRELEAYLDEGGVPTICDGDTYNVRLGDVATPQECDARLRRQLAISNDAINKYVRVKLADHERAALISFIYNVGVGAFIKSTLLRRLNGGDPNWCYELDRWVKVNGKVSRGLVKRRSIERRICLGEFSHERE